MILKFANLKKVGVFKNFVWDDHLKGKNNDCIHFDKLNIIYGQNYAGKTTLSRVMRSLETGKFSQKYTDASFSIDCSDKRTFTHDDLGENEFNVRVFNEDFIRRNVEFNNPDKTITPFAILGARNNEIEKEIERLNEILGNEDDGKSLYGVRAQYTKVYNIYSEELKNVEKLLQKNLSEKATGKEIGIKYLKKYEKINYDIKALRSDIQKIKNGAFTLLTPEKIKNAESLLTENIKDSIAEIKRQKLNFAEIEESISVVVTKVVGKSDKIEELVKNAFLNKWVKEGKDLHKPESKCSFCNGTISRDRWEELERHFDEESENLERYINTVLIQIAEEEKKIREIQFYRKELFYQKYTDRLEKTQNSISRLINEYLENLQGFKNKAIYRLNNILEGNDYEYCSDVSIALSNEFESLEYIRHESNNYLFDLRKDKEVARENLRLMDIYLYLKEIGYDDTTSRINYLEELLLEIELNEISVNREIDNILIQISDNIKLITDESKGAEKINEYLKHHFGHRSLRLEPVIIKDFIYEDKLAFEVQRDGKKAYHLSEGEKSLIAFCYFIAKLEEVETKGLKPVIWIDDPISSLDSNHIFFIYSLIKVQIYENKDFLQLFISTHNLNFLKYLKRLPTHNDTQSNAVRYFLVERIDENSFVREMPRYLQENATEFNHLFKAVYECANVKSVDDSNYTLFYNFGNNARKFLEIYLYYKYPNFENEESKYKKFFGSDKIPNILTNRLINEYSHLCGVIERGETPIEVPEMKKTAEIICQKMIEKDKDQYDALVKSIR